MGPKEIMFIIMSYDHRRGQAIIHHNSDADDGHDHVVRNTSNFFA